MTREDFPSLPAEKDFSFFLPRLSQLETTKNSNSKWLRLPEGHIHVQAAGWEKTYLRHRDLFGQPVAELVLQGEIRAFIECGCEFGKFELREGVSNTPIMTGTLPETWTGLCALGGRAIAAEEKRRIDGAMNLARQNDVFQCMNNGSPVAMVGHWFQYLCGAGDILFVRPLFTMEPRTEQVFALHRDFLSYLGCIFRMDDGGHWIVSPTGLLPSDAPPEYTDFAEALMRFIGAYSSRPMSGHERLRFSEMSTRTARLANQSHDLVSFVRLLERDRRAQ